MGSKHLPAAYLNKTIQMITLDGPCSSYSFHSITGKNNQPRHTLAAQCAIVTDLICKYVVGLVPRACGTFELAPLLPDTLTHLTFGPYNYCGKWITVKWTREQGHDLYVADGPSI